MWRQLTPRVLLYGALLIVAFLAFTGHGLIRDPDFFWHIQTGQWIVDHRMLPGHDIYTFWSNPHVWTDHEWLSEVLMWLVYSTLGAPGIVIGFALVTMAGFLLIMARTLLDRPVYLLAGAGLLLGLLAGAPIWGPRPQMLEFFFVCLELWWLERYLRAQPTGWRHGIYAMPLVMVVWSNLHGSWPSAFIFLGAAIFAQGVGWVVSRDGAAGRRAVRLLLVSAGAGVALLLNPNGLLELLYPFQTQGSAAQQTLIQEWFSPDFHLDYIRPFEVLMFAVLLACIARRPNLYSALLVLGTLAMALQSQRHIALFMAASTPVMINAYSGLWREHSGAWLERLKRGGAAAQALARQAAPAAPTPAMAALVAVGLLGLAGFSGVQIAHSMQGQAAYDRSDQGYPVAGANWLLSQPPSTCTRIYDQYGWGGYLVYRLYGSDHRVYIFGEAALMGDARLNDYEEIAIVGARWQQLLDSAGVDCVVYNRGAALTDALKADSGRWKLAYEDTTTDIFVRR